MPFSTIYDAVATRLQYVAASLDNPRKLSDEEGNAHVDPPLYVWDPQGISDATKDRGELSGNANPKGYGFDSHNWLVGCWGATRSDCERMRGALERAIRIETDNNYRLGTAQWAYPDWTRNGYLLVQDLSVFLPRVAVEIPTSAQTGIPEDDITDATATTATITAVDPADATGAVAGDNELQGGEG